MPTPDVHRPSSTSNWRTPESAEQVNMFLKDISLNSAMRSRIDYVDSPDVVCHGPRGLAPRRRGGRLATIVNNNSLVCTSGTTTFGYCVPGGARDGPHGGACPCCSCRNPLPAPRTPAHPADDAARWPSARRSPGGVLAVVCTPLRAASRAEGVRGCADEPRV
ncbi:hypothetical protein QJS66_10625 [Kocuria rhizophila]|nr:hypothetical protein QJS66_10625 [Kocuria rhizophila]